jgi:hypothetical protein
MAQNLMDTDYVLDNGLIQVREDGGYAARHNPMFSANINWSYFPCPFFNFKNDETTITLTESGNVESFDLSQLQVTNMHVENTSEWASIHVSKGNSLFNYTQIVTVYKGIQFVNMSMTLESSTENVVLNQIVYTLQRKGDSIGNGQTVGFYDPGGKVLGQLIFTEEQPVFHESGPSLIYSFPNSQSVEFELWASAFSVSDKLTTIQDPNTQKFLNDLMTKNLASYQQKVTDTTNLPADIYVFDYKKALADWNVSYVAVRDPQVVPKFANDPAFNLLFINDEVKIFKVR